MIEVSWSDISWLSTATNEVWQRLFGASFMMACFAFITMLLLRLAAVRSWRLRSWFVAAVLIQGLVLVRAPIELAWLPPEASTGSKASLEADAWQDLIIESEVSDEPVVSMGLEHTEQHPEQSRKLSLEPARPDGLLLSSLSWRWMAGVLWLVVLVAFVAKATFSYWRLLRMLKRLPAAPETWAKEWRHTCSSPARGQMLVSETVGPLLVRRLSDYVLVVPASYWQRLNRRQRESVMLHELAHLERGDVWRQLVSRLIATLHWFNPFAWWATRQYEAACELACDTRVRDAGPRMATAFAAALVELIQFRREQDIEQGSGFSRANTFERGIGIQTMAAPPLSDRVSRLIQPTKEKESPMKRVMLLSVSAALIALSCFQVRFIRAQETQDEIADASLQVMDDEMGNRLWAVTEKMNARDATSVRFVELAQQPSGRIAIMGYMDSLVRKAQEQAKLDAVPRFLEHHFDRNDQGQWVGLDASVAERWIAKAERLSSDLVKVQEAMTEIASSMEPSTEAAGLFKRLLEDPQAPAAVMISESDGGDVVVRYLSKALENLVVQQADGSFGIVDSRRTEVEKQVERLEIAKQLAERLKDEFPRLASEYVDDDARHQTLHAYLRKPQTASLVALDLSSKTRSIPLAVEQLYQHFEEASHDTATGLKFTNDEAWGQIQAIFERVDRVESVLPRIREQLMEYAGRMSTSDPLAQQLAKALAEKPLAIGLAAELPYANANPGDALRAMLGEVMYQQDGAWKIREEHEPEVEQRARELLQTCRRVRRYTNGIERLFDEVADRELVDQLGEAGSYVILNEVRSFAEQYRPDPIELMKSDLLVEGDQDSWSVREDRREVVRELLTQAERVRNEAANDDF